MNLSMTDRVKDLLDELNNVDLTGEREDGFDAGADDLRAGRRGLRPGISGQEGNPIHPPSRSGEGNKKGGEEFQIHAGLYARRMIRRGKMSA